MNVALDGTNNLAAYRRADDGTDADFARRLLVALCDRVSREDWDAAIAEATR